MNNSLPMPDQRTNRLQPEVYLSYAGGVNSFAKNHREMGGDTLRHLINGTVRGGWVETRPNFECLDITFQNDTDQTIFQTGKVQGSGYYEYGGGAVMVYAIDGHLFAVDPLSLTVQNIDPDGEQAFSKYSHFVYFQTRAGFLVAGDGTSTQVVVSGASSRLAGTGEVPASLMMADDWGRLVVVDPDRRRIRFSNHELDPDPSRTPLGFQEGNEYYLNAKWFKVPDHIGKIVWVGFMPQLNSDTGTGALLVLGENGTRYYDVSIPRQQWTTQDISGTLLPDIGGIAHRAQVTRNDNLIFSDQYGRIRQFKNAIRDEKTLTVKRFDRPVFGYFENETRDLRRFRCAVEFNERILVTVQPESIWHTDFDRYNVRHRGMVVWNGEVSEAIDERDIDVWDGLWTGIFPACLDVGRFGGREMCLALSVDSDGVNRVYRIHDDGEGRYDIAPDTDGVLQHKLIEMQLLTRQFDFSARDSDYSMLLKSIDRAAIRIGERWGKTHIQGRVISDQELHSRHWFDHRTNADHSICLSDMSIGESHHDPLLQLPGDIADGNDPVHCTPLKNFYKCAVHLVITGWSRIEEMMFSPSDRIQANTQNAKCELPQAKRNTGCRPDFWKYDATTATEKDCC